MPANPYERTDPTDPWAAIARKLQQGEKAAGVQAPAGGPFDHMPFPAHNYDQHNVDFAEAHELPYAPSQATLDAQLHSLAPYDAARIKAAEEGRPEPKPPSHLRDLLRRLEPPAVPYQRIR